MIVTMYLVSPIDTENDNPEVMRVLSFAEKITGGVQIFRKKVLCGGTMRFGLSGWSCRNIPQGNTTWIPHDNVSVRSLELGPGGHPFGFRVLPPRGFFPGRNFSREAAVRSRSRLPRQSPPFQRFPTVPEGHCIPTIFIYYLGLFSFGLQLFATVHSRLGLRPPPPFSPFPPEFSANFPRAHHRPFIFRPPPRRQSLSDPPQPFPTVP